MRTKDGMDIAIEELNKEVRGIGRVNKEMRVLLVGAILIAHREESFVRYAREYANKDITGLMELILKNVKKEANSIYKDNYIRRDRMVEYYSQLNNLKFKTKADWYNNPLYTVVQNITARRLGYGSGTPLAIYKEEIKYKELETIGETGYTKPLVDILIEIAAQETEGKNLILVEQDGYQKGLYNETGEVYTREMLAGNLELEYTTRLEEVIDVYTQRYEKVIYKAKEGKSTKEILKTTNEVAKATKEGGVCLAVLPITSLLTKSKEKEDLLENHTLEAVISLRASENVINRRPQCIVVLKANRPQESGEQTWFGYWGKGDKGGQEERLREYTRREEVKGISINQEVGYEDEWCPEQYIEVSYKELLGRKEEPKTIKISDLFEVKRSDVYVAKNLRRQSREAGGVALVGTVEGALGYYDGAGKSNKGGVILVTLSKPFYQRDEYISNAGQTVLRPKTLLTWEEIDIYLEALELNYKKFDKSRTPTISRVSEIRVPDLESLRVVDVTAEIEEDMVVRESKVTEAKVKEETRGIDSKIKEKEIEIQEKGIEMEENKIKLQQQELEIQEKKIELSKLRLEKQKQELEEYKIQEAHNEI